MKNKLIYLGGTYWRQVLLEQLQARNIDLNKHFNPVISEWTIEALKQDALFKKKANHLVYYIGMPGGDPSTISTYSIVDATMSLYDNPKKTVVAFDTSNMSGHTLGSMRQAEYILTKRFPKALILPSLTDLVDWLDIQLRDRSYK